MKRLPGACSAGRRQATVPEPLHVAPSASGRTTGDACRMRRPRHRDHRSRWSGVAQRQSARLLTAGSGVRISPPEPDRRNTRRQQPAQQPDGTDSQRRTVGCTTKRQSGPCACSSTWQSSGLLIRRLGVQLPPGAPTQNHQKHNTDIQQTYNRYAGEERQRHCRKHCRNTVETHPVRVGSSLGRALP
jgi:hypothetical protein